MFEYDTSHDVSRLRERIDALLQRWDEAGLPGRQTLKASARELRTWREEQGIAGLWRSPPSMATATLDDGFGFGLEVIEGFAEALGLRVHRLGLLLPPERVVAACRELRPEVLGLTVLQFDTEEALIEVARGLPPETRLIAGGAVLGADPDLARRAGLDFVARDAAAFLRYLLSPEPGSRGPSHREPGEGREVDGEARTGRDIQPREP